MSGATLLRGGVLCPIESASRTMEKPNASRIETMVDDILWKPLNAKRTKHRLGFLLELGARTFGA